MITIRLNVVAFILAAAVAAMALVVVKQALTYAEIAMVAVPTFIVIKVYESIAGLPAFRGKSDKKK